MPISESRASNAAAGKPAKTIAYLMSRFPKISETFVLYEIVELERLGLRVEIFPLLHQREPVMHPEAKALVERAHYTRMISRPVLDAQLYWLARRPRAYLRAWWRALRGNLRSPKFLSRALVVVPQAALFARKIQELGVEHVHAHWATHPTLAAYTIQILTDLPYSFTAHAHDIYVERAMLDEKIDRASFVVTISEYNRRLLGQLYGQTALEKTVVIHCGVDPAVFQPPQQRSRDGLFTIVCVASLEEKKGHPYLVDACAQLKARGLSFRCLLVGDGPDRQQIEAQVARLGLADQVSLLGQQPRHRVSELMAEADVVVLPSVTTSHGRQEGIPVVLMEALAAERPVVATNISGIPELIEDNQTGLLVREKDAKALADALSRLHGDPELGRRLAAAGRAKVLREFNLQHNTAQLYGLLADSPGVVTTTPLPSVLPGAVPPKA